MTLILALTLHRAQKTLALSVSNSFAAKDLSRFLMMLLHKRIIQSRMRPSRQGKLKSVKRSSCLLICEALANFLKTSILLNLIAFLREYQQLLVPIIREFGGGTIDKFMGDGILASFGAVIPSQTYAADALHAVDKMIKAAKQWKVARENQQ